MVLLQPSSVPNEPHQTTSEFDYKSNPTDLFKLIESKKWEAVKERAKDCPDEASAWISRRGNDGHVRWKILPLHAALCIKAPKDIIISLCDAFPGACLHTDDQGLLPIHLALQAEDVDEEVIRVLMKGNPLGLIAKDKDGKFAIGRPLAKAFDVLQELKREKIRKEEEENGSNDSLVHSTNLGSGVQKYLKIRKVNEELQQIIETQKNELAKKDEELQIAMGKLAAQEVTIEEYKKLSNNMCELSTALSNISDLKTTVNVLQEQLDSQEKDLTKGKDTTEIIVRKAEVEIKSKFENIAADAKYIYLASLEKLTAFMNEVIIQSKFQLEKIEESYKSRKGDDDSSSDGEKELATMKNTHEVMLEKVIMFLDESMYQFNDQMKVMKDGMKSRGVDVESIETKVAEVAEVVSENYRTMLVTVKDQVEKIDEEYKVQDKCRVSLEMATKLLSDMMVRLSNEMNKMKQTIKNSEMHAHQLNATNKGLATVNDMFHSSCRNLYDLNMCTSDNASSFVDYTFNPTVLFRLVESKQWDQVKSHIEENPEEASSWITRHRKDGTIRWKLLPLHAVLCIGAPTDIIVPVVKAYPEACSFADDQGLLPVDIAKNRENVDEEVVKILMDINPSHTISHDEDDILQQ